MNFDLKIMGTASAMPISDRNPSAQALVVHGRLFLIDCGEGTQQMMRRSHLSFVKVEAIFISHIHGDHVFGIFGLLSTMSMLGRKQDVDIFAPPAFSGILGFFLSYYGNEIAFKINFHPLTMKEPETVYEEKHLRVSAFPLRHKIECYGFRFDEVVKSQRTDRKPCSYAYCSDTTPFEEMIQWVKGVDVLYHEATYPIAYADKAVKHFHSTTHDAARAAAEAGVGKLLIGHYSSREYDQSVYERECRQIFPESYAAKDGDSFEIDYLRKV